MAQANNPGASVDLDAFLNANASAVGQQPGVVQAQLPDPQSDRMLVALFLVDDSGSMSTLKDAVIEGLTLSVRTLQGVKGSDCYAKVLGFHGTYFEGMINTVGERQFESYTAAGGTPLISVATSLLRDGIQVADTYRNQGIPTTIAMLILTDGIPDGDEWAHVGNFKALVGPQDYVVGMGIANGESAEQVFVDCFKQMGLTKFVTPKDTPTAVRRAINQFSQSVASIAA